VLQTLQDDPQWTVVALDYELGYLLEPKSAPPGWQPGQRPLARFWRFSRRIALSAGEAALWLAQRGTGSAGIGDLRPAIDEETYVPTVNRIKRLIFEGDCYQVNLTFPLEFEWFGSPLALYARLRERQPVRYGGFVGDDRHGLVSLSPELFLERAGERLRTKPMKGTASRSAPPEHLRNSEKDCAENLMIVDLLRNDLGRVAKKGSVVVDRLFDIEEYPTLWQMVSEISADVGIAVSAKSCAPCSPAVRSPEHRRFAPCRSRPTWKIASAASIPGPWAGWRRTAISGSTWRSGPCRWAKMDAAAWASVAA
jgi:para-aminobenzoate synthetase/4-amino-4-deoxychorismate lyase